MRFLLAAIVGYCLGSVSFAVIVGSTVEGIDVRKHGSGNAGAANVGSLLGVKYGVLVACFDIAKGMIAAIAGRAIGGSTGQMVSGAAAVIGHILPIWFGFRGGKAIASVPRGDGSSYLPEACPGRTCRVTDSIPGAIFHITSRKAIREFLGVLCLA